MGRIRAMLIWCALIQLFSFPSLVYGKPEVESSGGYYDDEDIMLRKGISCPPSVTCPAGQVCLMYKYPHCHVPEATPPPPNNCLNNPCGAGGSCVSMTAGYRCDCKFGYTGRNCEIKVKTNNCENHQCSLGSTCVALSVGYRCDCSPGYTGTYCSTNNCANNQCVFGTCVALSVGYRCECRAGYSGTYCNTRINNCDNNQCTSGSTCVALTSGYRCNCSPGYTGTYCSTNNCANNQCVFGTCVALSVGYRCECNAGYSGIYCNTRINNCDNNQCKSGSTCVALTSGYRCDCSPGYTGTYCSTSNCANNQCIFGTCVALSVGYRCECNTGYSGTYCNTRINNCDNNQCKSGSTCVSLPSGYRCDCEVGYSGRNCEIKVKTNNCENHQCSLGSTCVALSTGYRCDCSPGYTGTYCTTNNCANNQCVFGTCVALSVGYRCECNAGYSGTYCNTRINNCDNNQCTSGSTCVALTSGYRCNCSPGYTGTYCSTNNCANNQCVFGTCVALSVGYRCECNTGYSGTYCNTRINNCDNNQCKSGSTCVALSSGYRCDCSPGYTGTYCSTSNCANNQCVFGTCVALSVGYRCECNTGYSGTYCNTRINNCDNNQCKSGSTCVALTSGYRCNCSPGYTGTYCSTNNCANNQCIFGTCVALSVGYRCECNAGYSGTYCNTRINNCDNNQCKSGSTCVALTSGYRCDCSPGYTGTYCSTNNCANNQCVFGRCLALSVGYRCQCNAGYSGTYCNTRINNCDNNQCTSGSTCVNLSVGYRCDCTPTMTGVYCENKVCNLQCLNGGTCTVNKLGVEQCLCVSGFYGTTCENAGQACSPNPCVNGCNCVASCMHEGGYYCLDPTMQFTGRNCNNPVPRLECRYDRIVLTLESGFLQDFDKMEGDSYFYASQSFDDNQRLTECRARMNGNTYTVAIPFPFTSCGTIQTTSTTVAGELHKFNNKLWLNKQSNLPYDMPYPVAEFTCSYGYEYDFVTSLRPTVEPLRNEITTTEMFNATVSLCKTGACDQRCPSLYAVAEQAIYTVGEVVHVRFDIDYLRSSTGNNLVVSIDHLFLSCTKDEYSNKPRVDLLYAGCEMSEAFLKPNAGSTLKPGSACFSFMVPRLKQCPVIYIHATLRACNVNDVNNCPSGKQRCRSSLKRSIRNEIARTVTGPIIIVDGDGGVSSLELFPGGGNGSVPIEVAPMMKVPKVYVPSKSPILEDTTDENFDTPLVLTISIIAAVTCMALFALCCLVPVSKHRHDDQCKCDTLDL